MKHLLTYIIDRNDIIISTNSSWDEFAKDNDALELTTITNGRSIWDFIDFDEVKHLYSSLYEAVRNVQRDVFLHFRCDSHQLLRFMKMHISPMEEGALKIVTHMLREVPRAKVLSREILYLGVNKGVPMCSHCNNVRISTEIGWIDIDTAIEKNLISDELSVNFDLCNSCKKEIEEVIDNLQKKVS